MLHNPKVHKELESRLNLVNLLSKLDVRAAFVQVPLANRAFADCLIWNSTSWAW